jgi:hypothetical protein
MFTHRPVEHLIERSLPQLSLSPALEGVMLVTERAAPHQPLTG